MSLKSEHHWSLILAADVWVQLLPPINIHQNNVCCPSTPEPTGGEILDAQGRSPSRTPYVGFLQHYLLPAGSLPALLKGSVAGGQHPPPRLPFIIFTAKINEHINPMFRALTGFFLFFFSPVGRDDGKWTPWAQIYQQRTIARLKGGGKVRRTFPVGRESWSGLGFRWG